MISEFLVKMLNKKYWLGPSDLISFVQGPDDWQLPRWKAPSSLLRGATGGTSPTPRRSLRREGDGWGGRPRQLGGEAVTGVAGVHVPFVSDMQLIVFRVNKLFTDASKNLRPLVLISKVKCHYIITL